MDKFKEYKEEGADAPAAAAKAASAPAPAKEEAKPKAEAPKVDDSNLNISPLGKKFALAHGIELASLKGTGENGRILREDINRAINESLTNFLLLIIEEHKNIEVKAESTEKKQSPASKKAAP